MAGPSAATIAACLALAPLSQVSVAEPSELPDALSGDWVRQSAGGVNPVTLSVSMSEIVVDHMPCAMKAIRELKPARWYVDLVCGAAAEQVWLDINLLSENRIMMNRRPLAEADVYVRRQSGKARKEGAQ